MIISGKINLSAVLKDKLFRGEKGVYLDISILENKDGTDKYGNDFLLIQDIGKEARERGEKGPILGNGKWRVRSAATPPAPRQEDSQAPRYADEQKPAQGEKTDDLPW